MGMFDDLTVNYPLPDGNTATEFQTKDLGETMERYYITADGRLTFDEWEEAIDGSWRKTGRQGDMEYHGDIYFYGSGRYVVRFTHGVVEWIKTEKQVELEATGRK